MTGIHDDALAEQFADATLPPNVLVCERALLGGILYHGIHVARPLVAGDFYSEWHRELFQLIADLYERHPHIPHLDPTAVKVELFRRGKHARAVDVFCMYDEAIERNVSTVSARYHVEQILDTAEARLAQSFGQRLARVGGNPDLATRVMQEMQEATADIRARAGGDADQLGATRLSELARINRLAAATSTPAMSTGLVDLDRALSGGLRPSTINVLGARPGVGKSLLAGSIAVHVGSTLATRVLYLTMELSAAEVTNRMLSNIAGVELTRMQNPHMQNDNDLIALDQAQEQLDAYPIHVVEGGKTISEIETVGRSYFANAPSGLMIVDFLQRIREDGNAASRERHIAMCSSRLTDLSRELRIPLLCVVSFSRDSARRGTAPRMDDIRDSGGVESDADTVMLLWQPHAEDPTGVEVVIDKNRYGQVCTVDLVKQGSRGRLVSAARGSWAA